MIRHRIVEELGEFYPERKKLFYWSRYRYWAGCDPLGFDYGLSEVGFRSREEAEDFIKK